MDDLDEDNAKTKLSSSFALVASVGLASTHDTFSLVLRCSFHAVHFTVPLPCTNSLC